MWGHQLSPLVTGVSNSTPVYNQFITWLKELHTAIVFYLYSDTSSMWLLLFVDCTLLKINFILSYSKPAGESMKKG